MTIRVSSKTGDMILTEIQKVELPREEFMIFDGEDTATVFYRGGGEIGYEINPDYEEDEEFYPCVEIGENKYWLNEFMIFEHKNTFISNNFDGYCGTSNTGGDLIVLSESADYAWVYSM